ncbi:MAG: hypothetical protein ABIK20_04110 [Candidatus Omnitrophota bacterium]|nr:hypothetical protein [Candidatus Omnitrophota bacterium]
MKPLSAFPRPIRNFILSFRNGLLGIGYSLLLPVALLLEFSLIIALAVLFGSIIKLK